ncbi:hypothetical protein [Devosia sp.]|uniref:hypothetical protein n=1 Tax=Devosia sp. TaxID=1871048 RepID=UPI002735191C|nr:hypothetical protein [Devosia sp.]MDP2779850.1 hypothetical protein [Devosia sp.]
MVIATQMQVVAAGPDGVEAIAGYLQEDRGGFAAWDRDTRWLGKSERHRFPSEQQALAAIQRAYEKAEGTTVRLVRMAAAQ